MSVEETYLESFIDGISTLPNEIRRNLEHMKSLDKFYKSITEELREREEEYLRRSREIISSLPVESAAEHNLSKKRRKVEPIEPEVVLSEEGDGGSANAGGGGIVSSSSSTSSSSGKAEDTKGSLESVPVSSDEPSDGTPDETSDVLIKSEPETKIETKLDTRTTTETKTDDESKTNTETETETETTTKTKTESKTETTTDTRSDIKTETKPNTLFSHAGIKYGIPVPSSSTSTTLIVPTTEELRSKIHDREALVSIARLRKDAKRYSEEKIAVAEQTFAVVDAAVQKLEVDLERFEGVLKNSGCFEVSAGAQPDDLAAIQVTPNSPDWILAKVISHDSTGTGMYKLSDEDIESNKTFTLPESQVVILGGVDRLAKSDIIYAVYPDTTSFYQATVVQPPRKVAGGDAFVMVHFKDDGDENGITHEKAVLMKHIMRVPYGAIQ